MQRTSCSAGAGAKKAATNHDVVFVFIDYSKAFDPPSHDTLFDVIWRTGFPQHLIHLLKGFYVDNKAAIRWCSDRTQVFSKARVMRQGCIVSYASSRPTGNRWCENVETWTIEFVRGNKYMQNLRYVDDTVVIVNVEQQSTKRWKGTDSIYMWKDEVHDSWKSRGSESWMESRLTKWKSTCINTSAHGRAKIEIAQIMSRCA